MRQIHFFIVILFSLGFNILFGQEEIIDFRIQDESSQPIANAEVQLVQLPDSSILGKMYSGDHGLIVAGIPASENMVLRMTAPGHQTVWRQSDIADYVGIVTLMPATQPKTPKVIQASHWFSAPENSAETTLEGHWSIDLRPTPDAEPYFQELIIQPLNGKSFAGTFYNTNFKNGKINTSWGRTYFAFKTKDGKSTYYSSGYLEDETLRGTTYCEQRGFVMPWTGTRKQIQN